MCREDGGGGQTEAALGGAGGAKGARKRARDEDVIAADERRGGAAAHALPLNPLHSQGPARAPQTNQRAKTPKKLHPWGRAHA